MSAPADIRKSTLAVIMGGGAGKRLYPLTKLRSKPAVPFGGKYRLVDIPLSNCINSGVKHVYLLTQFNSASLHQHVALTYRFDRFSSGFVEILAAQQTPAGEQWYQGTADAVRQNLRYFMGDRFSQVLILSGDQLYRFDFGAMLEQHEASGADLTLAAMPVGRSEISRLGLLQVDEGGRVVRFLEKPKTEEEAAPLRVKGAAGEEPSYLASMGIYVFSRKKLAEALDNDFKDFGHHIIPKAIERFKVSAYIYKGYWEDIGTIGSFFEANLNLAGLLPRFNFFDAASPVFTHARALPASKVNGGRFRETLLSDGCIIDDSSFERCVLGVRSFVSAGCDLRETVILGADYYESLESAARRAKEGLPPMGIGRNCRIRRAIIDKNARIGEGSVITPEGKPAEYDSESYCVRDGIVVIPKGAVIPPGTKL